MAGLASGELRNVGLETGLAPSIRTVKSGELRNAGSETGLAPSICTVKSGELRNAGSETSLAPCIRTVKNVCWDAAAVDSIRFNRAAVNQSVFFVPCP